jgi:hypothetical protein
MLRFASSIPLLLALGACGDGGGSQQPVTKIEMANPISDQLKTASDVNKAVVLRRPIVDSGYRCKRVDAGAYQQQYKNNAMWTAHCTDSGDWAVFIGPTGDAQARACKDAAQLKLPECRPSPPLNSAPPAKSAQ